MTPKIRPKRQRVNLSTLQGETQMGEFDEFRFGRVLFTSIKCKYFCPLLRSMSCVVFNN